MAVVCFPFRNRQLVTVSDIVLNLRDSGHVLSATAIIFLHWTPISYPIKTSVLVPSHPLLPAMEIIYLQVGSMYSADITPGRGGPGTIKNGTVACLKAAASFKS